MEDAIIAEGGWKFNEDKNQYIVYTKEQSAKMFSANISGCT
jgi:hypothetical protein